MKEYEDIQIERDRSRYPKGMRHYSKLSVWENSLFDLDLLRYKLNNLLKGDNDGETDNTGSKETSQSTQKEILRGYSE